MEKVRAGLRAPTDILSACAGFLHLLYIPVRFLVTRPFMRISFQLPERFANVSVGTVAWSKVETESREAIQWVDKNEHILEGWFVGIYSFFVCSLVQVSAGHFSSHETKGSIKLKAGSVHSTTLIFVVAIPNRLLHYGSLETR